MLPVIYRLLGRQVDTFGRAATPGHCSVKIVGAGVRASP